ncbi:MAG: hypothetical protein IT388_08005 [Nitrospirales bacterium]|nr:hypothetical protein [Nitrospirales bacterium]
MKRPVANSEYRKTETAWNSKLLKEVCRGNKRVSGASAQNEYGAYGECPPPHYRSRVWSYHLAAVQTSGGLPVRILAIINESTRECLRSFAAPHISVQNVIDDLFSLFLKRGTPKYLFAYNDSDAMPQAICEWLRELEIHSTFVELKTYGENGCGTAFRNKLLRDLSGGKSFSSSAEVQVWLENWRSEYNRSLNLLRA